MTDDCAHRLARPASRRRHRHRREDAGRRRPRHVLVAGSAPAASTAATHRALRPVRAPRAVRLRGPRLRPDAVPRRRRRRAASTASRSSASRAAADALADAGDLGADPAACAVIVGTGIGGLDHARGAGRRLPREGRRPREPVLRPDDDDERDRGHDRDAASAGPGPNLCISTACAASAQRDRRRRRA